jgi:hypothetical protein
LCFFCGWIPMVSNSHSSTMFSSKFQYLSSSHAPIGTSKQHSCIYWQIYINIYILFGPYRKLCLTILHGFYGL